MKTTPVKFYTENNQPQFKHNVTVSNYSASRKALVASTTALGVATSLACLAKHKGYSLKPSKMFKNIKNSYLAQVEFHDKEVISMGVGTCLGGLAGGYMIDKNPKNRRAKRREAVMQIGNISIPILTVEGFAKLSDKLSKKMSKKKGQFLKVGMALAGIFTGVNLANFLMNHLSNKLFRSKSGERGVKATDYSAHLDDVMVAASYIAPEKYNPAVSATQTVSKFSKAVYYIARFIPAALMFAGNEVGNRTAD